MLNVFFLCIIQTKNRDKETDERKIRLRQQGDEFIEKKAESRIANECAVKFKCTKGH